MHTTLLHISWVLRWSGTYCIQSGTDAYKDIFIGTLQPLTSIAIWTEKQVKGISSVITTFLLMSAIIRSALF